MINQDIQLVTRALRSIERGDKEVAAALLLDARKQTRNRHIKSLAFAISDLHNLRPYTEQVIKDRQIALAYIMKQHEQTGEQA
jgi:hypothetical protein